MFLVLGKKLKSGFRMKAKCCTARFHYPVHEQTENAKEYDWVDCICWSKLYPFFLILKSERKLFVVGIFIWKCLDILWHQNVERTSICNSYEHLFLRKPDNEYQRPIIFHKASFSGGTKLAAWKAWQRSTFLKRNLSTWSKIEITFGRILSVNGRHWITLVTNLDNTWKYKKPRFKICNMRLNYFGTDLCIVSVISQ